MKAAVLEKIGAPLTVADVELGELPRGQVLVKILVSGMCGAQLQEIAGYKGNAKFVPHLLGHEGCGIVEKIGEDVTRVMPGDKVVMHWRKGEGIESDFPSYVYKGKKMSSGKVTTFSEYAIVSENRVTAVPQDTPDDLCALLGCGLSTALATVENDARVKAGEKVLIVGIGGLGACFIKAAKLAGAGAIVAVDIHDKDAAARALGATHFVRAGSEMRSALHAVDIESFNVIIETSGNAGAIAETLTLLGDSGRYILVGQPKPGESVEIRNAVHLFGGEGKTIKATQGGGFRPSSDIPRYIEEYGSGRLDIENLITHRTTLEKVNDALRLMREGKANRIMIDIWQ
ncbi:zinc-binding dehydrogenase [Candidatus Kaiserbacteria bacterium]|nr:zinc-binding dehydrogenase [Candidatus Kaiserbacteria bacterium]